MARYTLQLDDFEVRMYLGLHDFEKQTPQRVIIAATIETEIASYADHGFYDYDALATFIESFENTHVETQEELAERIHTFLVSSEKVVSAVVHTRKPDIFPDVEGVGVIVGLVPGEDDRPRHVIQLDGMTMTMYLGIHPYEKERPQRVTISATIVTAPDSGGGASFYDYDRLVDFLRGLDGIAIETQEELLERVRSFIMASDQVSHALVHSRKPDIYPNARSIGIIAGSLPFPYRQTMVATTSPARAA
ncbi:MAG: hypothetical protein CMO01_04835 [Thalassobius sp.]|nr:hypothetical protein [Thalassovita sp.]